MAESSRRRTVVAILIVIAALLATAGLALAAVLLSSRMLPGFEASSAPETSSAPVSSPATSEEETSAATVTEMVPAESSPAAPSTSSTSSAASASVSGGATTPQCDGRGVMIIESVVDDGTGAAQARISQLLAEHPGAQWYRPAACPSLRGSINGQSIYPVVVDYGRDFDRLCADFYAAGADPSYRNARILNNVSEAQSPC